VGACDAIVRAFEGGNGVGGLDVSLFINEALGGGDGVVITENAECRIINGDACC
jgi:hypothetical protein